MSSVAEPETDVRGNSKRSLWRRLRSVLFWTHLSAGLIAGPIIFIMSVTGVLLTYEKQMLRWASAGAYEITVPENQSRLTLSELVTAVTSAEGKAPSAITIRAGEDEPAEASFGREKTIYVDPYSGEVLGEGSEAAGKFFRTVTDWHRWLARPDESRAIGKAVTGVSNLAFLLVVATGLIIWFPRKWSLAALRYITWFKSGVSGKAMYFNWHNTIGFWCLVPLFIIIVSATVISFPWASNLIYKAVGEEPPPPRAKGGSGRGEGGPKEEYTAGPQVLESINGMVSKAENAAPDWKGITVQLPTSGEKPISVSVDAGAGGQPQKKTTMEFDADSGEVVKSEGFADLSAGRRLRSIMRFAHTGEVGGLLGQTIAGIASLGGAVLVVTGALLSWRRWRGRKSRAA